MRYQPIIDRCVGGKGENERMIKEGEREGRREEERREGESRMMER